MPTQVNTQRITKNTLLLYGWILLIMAVSLYTSRVVLNTLGMEDYGIYHAVGGIVLLFAFLDRPKVTSTLQYWKPKIIVPADAQLSRWSNRGAFAGSNV